MTRKVNIKTLPDGRVLVHWFQLDSEGPIHNPGRVIQGNKGVIKADGTTGRVACRPEQNTVSPQKRNGEIFVCWTTQEIRLVTCPECVATAAYQSELKNLNEMLKKCGNVSDVADEQKTG